MIQSALAPVCVMSSAAHLHNLHTWAPIRMSTEYAHVMRAILFQPK